MTYSPRWRQYIIGFTSNALQRIQSKIIKYMLTNMKEEHSCSAMFFSRIKLDFIAQIPHIVGYKTDHAVGSTINVSSDLKIEKIQLDYQLHNLPLFLQTKLAIEIRSPLSNLVDYRSIRSICASVDINHLFCIPRDHKIC